MLLRMSGGRCFRIILRGLMVCGEGSSSESVPLLGSWDWLCVLLGIDSDEEVDVDEGESEFL